MELLAANGRSELVPPVLLHHDDPEVRRRTLEVLAASRRTGVAPLVERRLGDEDPDVRAAAIQALAALKGADACRLMLPHLGHSDPRIRGAAVACLADHGDDAQASSAKASLLDMLAGADPSVRAEAAEAIGRVREPKLRDELLHVLFDADSGVVRAAVGAVRRRVARDGFVPLYAPILISMLRRRQLKHDAREALVALGEPIIPALIHFMEDRDEAIWVRRALPKTIARIGTEAAVNALVSSLPRATDAFLRRKLVEALGGLGGTAFLPDHEVAIEEAVRNEARRYSRALEDLEGLGFAGRGRLEGPLVVWAREEQEPGLLERMLSEQMEESLSNQFRLLALLHVPESVRAAHRSLTSGRQALRSHAIEFLDNTLTGPVRRNVLAIVDDRPRKDKLALGRRLFGLVPRTRADVLRRHLAGDVSADGDAVAMKVAALYEVYATRAVELYPQASALAAETSPPLVRETADWVARRVGARP
jgi:HEAT repeat protein